MTMNFRKAWKRALINAALLCAAPCAFGQTYFAGTVVDSANQPLAGVTIDAGHVTFPIWGQFISDGQATTDASGHYAITTLAAGDGSGKYVLRAQLAGHIGELYPDTYCIDACPANFPPVSAPPNLSADFLLYQSASISGTVKDAQTNTAMFDAIVLVGSRPTFTDSSGNYRVSNLLPGQYTVSLQGYSYPNAQGRLPQVYAGHDYDETLPIPAGDSVNVSDGLQVSGIDFAANTGGSISGSISSALDSAPLQASAGIRRLTPIDSGSDYAIGVTSNGYAGPQWGSYRIGPLLPGTFKVQFGPNGFTPQFYNGVSDEAQAQVITLGANQQITGINAQLTALQTIAGTVTDAATGLPLAGALVHSGQLFGISLAEGSAAVTDASGHYLLQGLTPTPNQQLGYYIWVYSLPGYLDTYYPGVPAGCCPYVPGGAQRVELAASQFVTGIDFALNAGAYASGRVYDADTGYFAAGMQVDVLDSAGNDLGGVRTDDSGRYTTDAVPVGDYYLVASFGNSSIYYPNYICPSSGCVLGNAQLLHFSTTQKYDNLDFAVPHLDLVFRAGFEQ